MEGGEIGTLKVPGAEDGTSDNPDAAGYIGCTLYQERKDVRVTFIHAQGARDDQCIYTAQVWSDADAFWKIGGPSDPPAAKPVHQVCTLESTDSGLTMIAIVEDSGSAADGASACGVLAHGGYETSPNVRPVGPVEYVSRQSGP